MYKFIGKLPENSIFHLITGEVYYLMFNKNEIGTAEQDTTKEMVFVHTSEEFNNSVALIPYEEADWEVIDASKSRTF